MKGECLMNSSPIAIVDGGDLLCMHKNTGCIYYWFHEEDDWGLEGNQKYPAQVGTDLNSFIDNLTTSPQPTQEEIRQVMKHGSVTITPKAVELKKITNEKQKDFHLSVLKNGISSSITGRFPKKKEIFS